MWPTDPLEAGKLWIENRVKAMAFNLGMDVVCQWEAAQPGHHVLFVASRGIKLGVLNASTADVQSVRTNSDTWGRYEPSVNHHFQALRRQFPTTISHLWLHNWRQFRDLRLDFDAQLTILTGANGTGKTTVLNLLAQHFGWHNFFGASRSLRSNPTSGHRGEPGSSANRVVHRGEIWTEDWLSAYLTMLEIESDEDEEPPPLSLDIAKAPPIGEIRYADSGISDIRLADNGTGTIGPKIQQQATVKGLYISSHRPTPAYQPVLSIPTQPRLRQEMFNEYLQALQTLSIAGQTQKSPSFLIKETLIALGVFGYKSKAIKADVDSRLAFEGFENVLRLVLPPAIGFRRLLVRLPELIFKTKSGEFPLEAMSGGIAALVDIAYQIFFYGNSSDPRVVLIDEPENHLHPELQRSLLGNLLKAFPGIQFICATHNPFIVTSVPNARVYALRHGDDKRVSSTVLPLTSRSGTADEILRDVLGLLTPSPLWVEDKLREIEEVLAKQNLDQTVLEDLRLRLRAVGLERYLPESLARIANKS